MEIDKKDEKSLINTIEYQVYDNKTVLDLSLCNNSKIQVFHSIKDSSLININSISSFKDSGIDIFNIKDSFFNDICQPYSDSKNDIILEDRIKDIYMNYSLCEEGCNYNEINTHYMTISCDCHIKTHLTTNQTSVKLTQFDDIKIESNFGIIKCFNLVFSFQGKLKNIGFWIFLFLVLIKISLLILYFSKGIKPIKEYLIKEMVKYGYIKRYDRNKILKKKENKNDGIIKKGISKNINNRKKNSFTKKKNKINFPPFKKEKNKKKDINDKNKDNIEKIDKKVKTGKKSIKSNKLMDNSSIIEISDKKDRHIIKDINNKKKTKKINKNSITKKKSKISISIKNPKLENSKEFQDIQVDSSNNIINNINNIPTQEMKKYNERKELNNKKGNTIVDFRLININLNNIKKYTPQKSLLILNNYTFEEAIEYDMRSICAIFFIFLLSKEPACHAFLYRSPLELFSLRLCFLIFIISNDLALNAFFYFNDNISEKYKYARNLFLFTFSNNITIILLSTLVGFIFMTLFTNLSNSVNSIRDIFRKEEEKLKKDKKYEVTKKRKEEILDEIKKILKKHKIKVIILIIIEVSLMIFFWYYVTAFCHVYPSTQTSWLLDSFLSILSRIIIISLISLGFAKLYRISIESRAHCIYKFVLFFYSFG